MKTSFTPAQIAQIHAVLKLGVVPPLASTRDEQCKRLAAAFLTIAVNPYRSFEWYHAAMTAPDLTAACAVARDFILAFRGVVPEGAATFTPTGDLDRAPILQPIAGDVVDDSPEPEAPAVIEAPEVKKWGRRDLDGMSISATTPDNWRREGSHGWRTVQIIIENPGLMIDQIEDLGGRSRDVIEDLTKNPEKLDVAPS